MTAHRCAVVGQPLHANGPDGYQAECYGCQWVGTWTQDKARAQAEADNHEAAS